MIILLIISVSGAIGVAMYMKNHKGNLRNDTWWRINYEDIIILNDNKVKDELLCTETQVLYHKDTVLQGLI